VSALRLADKSVVNLCYMIMGRKGLFVLRNHAPLKGCGTRHYRVDVNLPTASCGAPGLSRYPIIALVVKGLQDSLKGIISRWRLPIPQAEACFCAELIKRSRLPSAPIIPLHSPLSQALCLHAGL
jgi:hypothetical protein